MTRTLLIVVAAGFLVSLSSFTVAHLLGPIAWPMGHGWRHYRREDAGGPAITRDLPWAGSESVSLNDMSDITYTQGPTAKFTVTGPADLVDALTLDGDTLEGERDHWRRHWGMNDNDRLRIVITSPHTHVFRLSGAHVLTIAGYDQDDLELHISGASAVTASGKARRADLHLSGAGSVDLSRLPVDDATVSISGAGSATLDPKKAADISISGAGHVSLLTKPADLHTSISGLGSISTP
jgi:hypothetical protein